MLHLYKILVRDFHDDWVEVHFLSDGLLLEGLLKNRILLHLEDYSGSMVVTASILLLRIQNIFVTTCCCLLIFSSIWTTVFLTRDVFGVNYISEYHSFIILFMAAF